MLLIDNPVVTNCLIDQVCCCFSLGSHKFPAGFNLIVQGWYCSLKLGKLLGFSNFHNPARLKFIRIEISYNCRFIEGYWTRNIISCRKRSFYKATVGSWLRMWLFEAKDCLVFSTDQPFRGVGKVTPTYLVPYYCKCAVVKFSKALFAQLSYDCKTGFRTKLLDPSPVA